MKTVVKAAVRLGMTLNDFIESDPVSVFDQEVGKTLGRVANSLSISIEEIEQETSNKVVAARLSEIFRGCKGLTVEELRLICGALGCSADKILESAAKAVQQKDGKKMVA
ncbi:hypothetical protein ADUPG1_001500 [Aduncisulcus paluster]|uniref:XRE family transcriptional regulator n=1 Tax=Aduncisulcus paluster TaxID=2918883 RepID=A0ABQ5KCW5_9EUKA|nr:hypothetical protein ADUPG1_001500 [Aduncisulcus paluster]